MSLNPKQIKFLDNFFLLFRSALERGVERPRVAVAAALVAGYGETSWNDRRRRVAADSAQRYILKLSGAIEYLEMKGMEYDEKARRWTLKP